MTSAQIDSIAESFAEHLQNPGESTALRLADELDRAGETERAQLLRSYAEAGEHEVSTGWWAPNSACQLSLDIPAPARQGQLWFDPFEVTVALLLPWPHRPDLPARFSERPPFFGWISLTTVQPWQILGAHLLVPELPARQADYTGEDAINCCVLFGKTTTGILDWLQLKKSFGEAILDRVWGDTEIEFAGGAGISGFVEIVTHDDLDRWGVDHPGAPPMVDELDIHGYAFRSYASAQSATLYRGAGSLARTWNA